MCSIRIFLVIAFLTAPLQAATVVLTPDRDNTLFESASGNTSSALGPNLFAGRTASGEMRRTLLHFDAGAIPAGSTITSAFLTLRMNRTRSGIIACSLHRVEDEWGNGNSDEGSNGGGAGAAATPDDPTWLYRFFNTVAWAQPGGDFDPFALASTSVGNVGTYTWGSNAALVAEVQSWVDSPSTNFGWMVRGGEASLQTAKRFDSVESTTAANRPRLTIEFTPGSPVETATWSGIKNLFRD